MRHSSRIALFRELLMKQSLAIAIAFCIGPSAIWAQEPSKRAPEFPQFERREHNEDGKKLPYRLMIPSRQSLPEPWPLIVWLHGSGERGSDNSAQMAHLAKTFLVESGKCPALVMVPQCPDGSSWLAVGLNAPPKITEPSRMIIATIAELQKEFPVDDRRIYIGGFSMGGCGTWDLLSRYPDLFAAAFPIAGPPGDRKALAPVIRHIPIWIFHGGRDKVAPVENSRSIAAALKEAGSPVKYTEYPDMGHETFRPLSEPALTEWLFAQKRSAAPSFEPVSVPESAALFIKTLPHDTHDTWAGPVHRTGHGVPRVVIGGVAYRLKAAKQAAPAVSDLLTKIGKGEVNGECTVSGTVDLAEQAWISVDDIALKK